MIHKKINADISVGPQFDLTELEQVKAAGFKSIIVNRPNNEEDGQPDFSVTEESAKTIGLATAHIPMRPGHMTDEAIQAFAKALVDLPKPILAHCKSGLRSAMLWAFAEASQGKNPADILQAIKDAGYDMPGIEPHLLELSSTKH